MPFVPPPLALTKEEFEKRWNAGARTLKELDPALWRWNQQSEYQLYAALGCISLFIIAFGIILFFAWRS